MKKLFLLLGLILLSNFAYAEQDMSVDELIDRIDKLYRSKTSYAEVDMTIKTPHYERTISLKMWSEGMDKTFITILAPKKDKGITTLRVGTEMWNYFPNINKVMKVPPSMMMGSWMGSDLTNDDLVKESTYKKDYDSELIAPKDAEESYYYIKSVPKESAPTVWGKVVTKVRKDNILPETQDFYDEHGKKIRVFNFKEVKELGKKLIPTIIEVVPLNKEGHSTIFDYKEANFDIDIDEEVFSLRNLQIKR